MDKYHFHDTLMLRTPAFSYKNYNLTAMGEVIKDSFFKGALYLANPVLYNLLANKSFNWALLNSKEQLSLTKYYNRMSFRPTPFGAFAAFAIVKWGVAPQIVIPNKAHLHLYFDQVVNLKVFKIVNNLDFEQSLCLNPTIYQVGKEFRYIKSNLGDNETHMDFSLESLQANFLLETIKDECTGKHSTVTDLVKIVTSFISCSADVALDYIRFLINAQWLFLKSYIHIIGPDYISALLNNFIRADSNPGQSLKDIYQTCLSIGTVDNSQLFKLANQLNGWLTNANQATVANTFYAGLENQAIRGSLNEKWQKPIKDTLTAMSRLTTSQINPVLNNFIELFLNKFERQKIPLMQALDPYIGIGYADLESEKDSTLLERLRFGKQLKEPPNLAWSEVHQLLMSLWLKLENESKGIVLTSDDISKLKNGSQFTASGVAVMFRLVESDHLFIESVSGGPATALIGRFSLWSHEAHKLAREIAKMEQLQNPGVLFAEIAQLSDAHVDNINRRQQLYSYEIPVNALSVLPKENQIQPSDLLVSVVDGQIRLESASLKKIVIPRLSSAYNYSRNELALFRFLCDIQQQGTSAPVKPDLEQFFPGLSYYPRLSYEKTMLSPAKWYLKKEDLLPLTAVDFDEARRNLKEFINKVKLPDIIAIVRHDQQIVIDLKSNTAVTFFLQCIRGETTILLQEFLFPTVSNPIADIYGKPYINQWITFLYREVKAYPDKVTTASGRGRLKEPEFMLGSQWLYLKLYCNPSIANTLLVQKLSPIIHRLQNQFNITWFFIRYQDEGYHIRLRIKTVENKIGSVIQILKRGLWKDVRLQLVRQYQADIYRPEWERYGSDILETVECFFNSSSALVLIYLKRTMQKNFQQTYHSLAFVSVAEMISVFLPGLNQQLSFLEQMSASFYNEFSEDKLLRVDLNDKYRQLKVELEPLLEDQNYYQKLKLITIHKAFIHQLNQLANAKAMSQQYRRNTLLADLIHMHLNRLFATDQRRHELVVYYCLWKMKIAELAKHKSNS